MKLLNWVKKETVCVAAAICALGSALLVPPSPTYWDYIDLRVLCLLFSLMIVVAGFQSCNLFGVLTQKLLQGKKQMNTIILVLVLLPFFTSMLITNDVALITFVPFAILALGMVDRKQYMIPVIVLQTIAANLGSMATPLGNPQNLYLYTEYRLSMADFWFTMGKFTICSFVLLVLCSFLISKETLQVSFSETIYIQSKLDLALYLVLFVCCALGILRILHFVVPLAMAVGVALWRNRYLLKKADYGLLLTFVFFFIFSGNIGRIPFFQEIFHTCMQSFPLGTAILTSQVISNVPSAVLLSQFTNQGTSLLVGTNLGGLGTLIASLASLISYKFYVAEPEAKAFHYLGVFTILNVVFLAVLIIITYL